MILYHSMHESQFLSLSVHQILFMHVDYSIHLPIFTVYFWIWYKIVQYLFTKVVLYQFTAGTGIWKKVYEPWTSLHEDFKEGFFFLFFDEYKYFYVC